MTRKKMKQPTKQELRDRITQLEAANEELRNAGSVMSNVLFNQGQIPDKVVMPAEKLRALVRKWDNILRKHKE